MISVLVVDDQALVRGGFRMILDTEPDIEVCGEAEDGAVAVSTAIVKKPDVVLMDVRMPTMDGIEATRQLLAAPEVTSRVLMLTTFDLDEYVYDALRAGASGFLLKDVDPQELVHAVRAVARGDALLAPVITRRLIAHYVQRAAPSTGLPPPVASLTDRELDVLRLIARGLTNAEIAVELHLSPATIKTHVARLLSKANLRDRVQAVVLAYESGLVQPGDSEAPS
jgi:DNA-binding NarL/FixJ family response regulator